MPVTESVQEHRSGNVTPLSIGVITYEATCEATRKDHCHFARKDPFASDAERSTSFERRAFHFIPVAVE